MYEFFQIAQRARNFVRRRRDINRIGERAARGPDPVLRRAQLARLQSRAAAAHALHQALVNVANQAHGDGKFFQLLQAEIHRRDMVGDFGDIAPLVRRREYFRLRRQQIMQRRLRAFNLAGMHRLFAHIHLHKQIGVRQRVNRTVQPPDGEVGLRQGFLQFAVNAHRRRRRQRRGNERAKPRRLANVAPRAGVFGCGRHGDGNE